jgi:hypothetical protein
VTGTPALPTNFDRLKKRLKEDGLAARLVSAWMSAGPAGQQDALKKVMSDRLHELRESYARSADQKT